MQKRVHLVDLVKSFQTSIKLFTIYIYLLSKMGLDTAENELRVTPNRLRVLRITLRAVRLAFF